MAEGQVVLRLRPHPLRAEEIYSLEDGELVRRAGRRVSRWPLHSLHRMILGVRQPRYAARVRFVRLRLGRRVQTIACASANSGYAPFVRSLAREAALRAPAARIEAEGGRLAGAIFMAVVLLGAGAAALASAALMAGLAPLALDLAARLTFLLILIFALTPWIGRAGPRRLDPAALPDALLD